MYQRILVPVDGSETSRHGLQEAIRLAKMNGGRLCLINVVDELSFGLAVDGYGGAPADWIGALREGGQRTLAEAKAQAEAAGIDVATVLRDNFSAPVHQLVVEEAVKWPADLIVLGTHGRRGISRIALGSTAENVLRRATVPVLLVRLPEAVVTAGARDGNAVHVSDFKVPAGAVASE